MTEIPSPDMGTGPSLLNDSKFGPTGEFEQMIAIMNLTPTSERRTENGSID